MSDIRIVARGAGGANRVRSGSFIAPGGTPDGALYVAPYELSLVQEGRVFMATDGDANDVVTGQTSFADTTPTFSLEVPSGTTAMLLNMYLGQAGTVAGGAITVDMAISSAALSRASGGTAEATFCARTDAPNGNSLCTLYSNPTATTALLTKQVRSWLLGPDVSPAEGAVQEVIYNPAKQGHPILLVGPAALGVFSWAGTTGPTWFWSFSWAEFTTSSMLG